MKIRYKKIRGKNRRIRNIQKWINENLIIDFNHLERNNYDYVKFRVSPWDSLNISSVYPQPQGIYKELLLEGLIKIYFEWKRQLDLRYDEYYLKIWLFEKNTSKCQIVCAINDRIEYYKNVFEITKENIPIENSESFKNHSNILKVLEWGSYIEVDAIPENYVGKISEYDSLEDYLELSKWYENEVLKKHISIYETKQGEKFYIIETDRVWTNK